MCGRLDVHYPPPIIRLVARFGAKGVEILPSYNVAPTHKVPVLWMGKGAQVGLMPWGITPKFWPKDSPRKVLFNARAETVWEKANFKEAVQQRRCIVLANGFYEWKAIDGHRQPWYIRLTGARPLAMAGIWQAANDGGECCIVTTTANQAMAPIHDRMPVILDIAGARAWLEADSREASEAIMTPCPSAWLEKVAVSDRVNSVRNRDVECIAPYQPMKADTLKPVKPKPIAPDQISINFFKDE